MYPGSRGDVDGQVTVAVWGDEAGTQSIKFRFSAVGGPVGQVWACGGERGGVGAGGEVAVGAGEMRLSMSL